MKGRECRITIEGKTDSDIVYALEEVIKAIEQGFHRGSNSNDTGNYYFESKEIEMEDED